MAMRFCIDALRVGTGVFSLMSQIIIAAMIAAIKASALRIVVPDEGTWCCRSGLN
jgi:hypothetical protein